MLLRRKQNPLGEARAVRSIPIGAARLRRDEPIPDTADTVAIDTVAIDTGDTVAIDTADTVAIDTADTDTAEVIPGRSHWETPRIDDAETAGRGRDTICQVDFVARVERGTSFAVNEPQLLSVAQRAVAKLVPNGSSTWLVNADDQHLGVRFTLGDTPTHCGVSQGWMCPAIATGQAQRFDDSAEIDACPHLASYPDPCAAACIPVTTNESLSGVVHIVAPIEEATDSATLGLLDTTFAMVAARFAAINESAPSPTAATTTAAATAAEPATAEPTGSAAARS